MTAATLETAAAPAAELVGDWELDAAHSTVGFVSRYLMFSRVRGHFGEVTGSVRITPDLAGASARGTIQAASIDTGNPQRDGHLRGADFFDVETHPTIEFELTGVVPDGDAHRARGQLTIRGVTRPVELRAEFLGTARDPFGRQKAAVRATGSIDREDFGLTWNQALETGGVLVGKQVDLEIEAQLIRQ